MPVGEIKYGVVADAIESSRYMYICMSTGISRAHRVHRRFPFSGWPVVGSQLRILSPFQDRSDERPGTGTPWTLPDVRSRAEVGLGSGLSFSVAGQARSWQGEMCKPFGLISGLVAPGKRLSGSCGVVGAPTWGGGCDGGGDQCGVSGRGGGSGREVATKYSHEFVLVFELPIRRVAHMASVSPVIKRSQLVGRAFVCSFYR